MKIVCEIEDKEYLRLVKDKDIIKDYFALIIANGTSLSEVLKGLKAEMKEAKRFGNIPEHVEMLDYVDGIDRCLDIINFYIGKEQK